MNPHSRSCSNRRSINCNPTRPHLTCLWWWYTRAAASLGGGNLLRGNAPDRPSRGITSPACGGGGVPERRRQPPLLLACSAWGGGDEHARRRPHPPNAAPPAVRRSSAGRGGGEGLPAPARRAKAQLRAGLTTGAESTGEQKAQRRGDRCTSCRRRRHQLPPERSEDHNWRTTLIATGAGCRRYSAAGSSRPRELRSSTSCVCCRCRESAHLMTCLLRGAAVRPHC